MGLAQVLSGKTEVSENLGTSETASAQKGAVKGDLSRSEARSESAAKLSLWDPAAVLMILSVYVTQFVAIGDRGFTQMSLWIMIGVLLLAAVVCVALIALRPQTLRPVVLTILTAAVLYLECGFPLPVEFGDWLLAQTSMAMVLVVRILAYALPIAIFYWLARQRLSILLTLLFGALAATGLVMA